MNKSSKKSKPEPPKTFVGWLVEQKDRADPVGGLARETAALLACGGNVTTYKHMKLQMVRMHATQQAWIALRMAHAENKNYTYKPRGAAGGVE